MLLAMAIVVSVLESFIPMFIPGFKLGLANVITLIMLYEFRSSEAFLVQILRIVIVGLLRGTFLSPIFIMSISGGLLSFLFMWIFTKFKLFTPIGVSVLGAVTHSLGQIAAAIFIIGTDAIMYYFPFIGLLSLGSGILSGVIAYTYLKRSITGRFVEVKNYNNYNN
jgi:heptaprenyl diphosphate synthase